MGGRRTAWRGGMGSGIFHNLHVERWRSKKITKNGAPYRLWEKQICSNP